MHGVLALLVAAAIAACDETPTNPGPIGPTPDPVSESFSGTLTVNGAVIFPFSVAQPGAVTATVTALGPDPAAIIGISVGMWTGTTCQVVLDNANASINSQITGTVNLSTGGSLCARIYDAAGKLTGPVTFTIAVAHY
jgi:hypothetical protein